MSCLLWCNMGEHGRMLNLHGNTQPHFLAVAGHVDVQAMHPWLLTQSQKGGSAKGSRGCRDLGPS